MAQHIRNVFGPNSVRLRSVTKDTDTDTTTTVVYDGEPDDGNTWTDNGDGTLTMTEPLDPDVKERIMAGERRDLRADRLQTAKASLLGPMDTSNLAELKTVVRDLRVIIRDLVDEDA